MPFFQIFSRATQAPAALGALRGMVQAFIDFNRGKVSRRGTTIGEIRGHARGGRSGVACRGDEESGVQELRRRHRQLSPGPPVPMDDRRQFRFQSSQIPPRVARVANELFRICGGNAIYESHAFGRYLNDIMAIQTHQLNNYQLHAKTPGRAPCRGDENAACNYYA